MPPPLGGHAAGRRSQLSQARRYASCAAAIAAREGWPTASRSVSLPREGLPSALKKCHSACHFSYSSFSNLGYRRRRSTLNHRPTAHNVTSVSLQLPSGIPATFGGQRTVALRCTCLHARAKYVEADSSQSGLMIYPPNNGSCAAYILPPFSPQSGRGSLNGPPDHSIRSSTKHVKRSITSSPRSQVWAIESLRIPDQRLSYLEDG